MDIKKAVGWTNESNNRSPLLLSHMHWERDGAWWRWLNTLMTACPRTYQSLCKGDIK